MDILGDKYSFTQKKLSLFILIILVLISSAACQGSHDLKSDDHGDIRSGLITVMSPPPDRAPYPYQIDFSELDTTYYDGTKKITVIEPDLMLSGFDLMAPNGINDHGRVWNLLCPSFTSFSFTLNDYPILIRYQLRYFFSSLIAPAGEYQTDMELEWCHRYYIKTAEGETLVLIHVGSYIGGIERQHFYWSYLIYRQ